MEWSLNFNPGLAHRTGPIESPNVSLVKELGRCTRAFELDPEWSM